MNVLKLLQNHVHALRKWVSNKIRFRYNSSVSIGSGMSHFFACLFVFFLLILTILPKKGPLKKFS
jgi:hypothetical protein